MMKFVFFVLVLYVNMSFCWTWSFKKTFKSTEFLAQQRSMIFENVDTNLFTQLIFSFNAHRPSQGYYSFYVQVHTYKGDWGDYYKMLEWGNGVQKSYLHKSDSNEPSYHHVRLEMPKNKFADGFRIKIQAHEGAFLDNVKMVSASISNFQDFKPERPNDLVLKNIFIKGVPKNSQIALRHQDSNVICSPTSLSMLLGYLKKDWVNPASVAKNVYDKGLGVYGSWPFNTAHAFEVVPDHYFRVMRLKSFKHLYSYLQKGFPVVVSVRGSLQGAPKTYDAGHLILVVGWDQKNHAVIVHDPRFEQDERVCCRYRISDFLKAWEKSNRLAYTVEID